MKITVEKMVKAKLNCAKEGSSGRAWKPRKAAKASTSRARTPAGTWKQRAEPPSVAS